MAYINYTNYIKLNFELHFEIETFDQIKDNDMRAHHLQHRYISYS